MAEGADPIEAIQGLARRMALEAMDDGWSGPPYDPDRLARHRGIAVEPNEDIPDARTIPAAGGAPLTVEYNPNRPRAGIRHSIARELAHTLFPDHAERIRSRAARESAHDDQEVELLCDVAAAELLLPAVPEPRLRPLRLTMADILRAGDRHKASPEAALIRLVYHSARPAVLLSASRAGDGAGDPYAVDYAVCPPGYSPPFDLRGVLSMPAITMCTAIECKTHWSGKLPGADGTWRLECIGVRPPRGRTYPRVLAVVRPVLPPAGRLPAISYRIGDATRPVGPRPAIIAHVANDRTPRWGSGFGRALAAEYPGIGAEFMQWAGARPHLGRIHVYEAPSDGPIVVTMVAQSGHGPYPRSRVQYAHLDACLEQLAGEAVRAGASVHMPRIGAGPAKGDWAVIGCLIHRHLIGSGVDTTVYDAPP